MNSVTFKYHVINDFSLVAHIDTVLYTDFEKVFDNVDQFNIINT